MDTDTDKLNRELDGLFAWLADHEYNVDHTAFERRTSRVLGIAFHGRRTPVIPAGVLAVDLACVMARRFTPTALVWSKLPGASEWRTLARMDGPEHED